MLRGLGDPDLHISRVLHDKTLAPGTDGLELPGLWSLTAAADGAPRAFRPVVCNSGGTGFETDCGRCGVMYIGA